MGKPKSVFVTQKKNEIPKVVKVPVTTKKPESVFVQNEVTQNFPTIHQTIEDISGDIEDSSNSFLEGLFKTDNNKKEKVSYEIITSNFTVVNDRIKGTIIIKSSSKGKTKLISRFSPKDLRHLEFDRKINDLNFNSDLTETIQINESAKGNKEVTISVAIHDNKTIIGSSEKIINVEVGDSQDMPTPVPQDNTMKYIVIGVGLLGLALIIKRIRTK